MVVPVYFFIFFKGTVNFKQFIEKIRNWGLEWGGGYEGYNCFKFKKKYYFFLTMLGNNYLKLVLILVFYSMTFFIRSNRQLFAHVNCDTRLFDY